MPTPIDNLLSALTDALERGTAILDTDRTFTVRHDEVVSYGGVSIEPRRDTVTIEGWIPRLRVNGNDAFHLAPRDRLALWRWRRRTRRQLRRDNTASLTDIARLIAPPSI